MNNIRGKLNAVMLPIICSAVLIGLTDMKVSAQKSSSHLFKTDAKAEISLKTDRLDIKLDSETGKRQAILSGNVKASQGPLLLHSDKAIIENQRGQVGNINVRGNVMIVSDNGQQANGDWANYEIGKKYKVKVEKITDYGCFCSLEPGLSTLLHSSEISWTKKNISPKKMFNVGDQIECVITEIDKEKRRVAISHRLTKENPFEQFEKKYPIGTVVEGEVVNKNEYSLFVKIEDLDVDAFLHCNDLTYFNNGEEELSKYKKGDKIKVKVLEIKTSEQKIRVGLRQTQTDPFDWFKDKSKNQTITVKVISTDNKGLIVRPEGCEMDFQIRKAAIAINAADARPSRWTGGEKLDCAIADLDLDKRKVTLSIKLLEEIEKKEALEKYGSEGSGKNLPFSSLSEDLKKKEEKN